MSAVVGGLFASFLDCRRKEEPPRLEWKNKFDSIVKVISNLNGDCPDKLQLSLFSLNNNYYFCTNLLFCTYYERGKKD